LASVSTNTPWPLLVSPVTSANSVAVPSFSFTPAISPLEANPLQDWRIAKGRIECTNAAADRNVQVLTRHIGERKGTLDMRVRVGRVEGGNRSIVGSGAEGFSDM
jgi:hypothetical protein